MSRKGPTNPGMVAIGKGLQIDKKKVDVNNTGYSTGAARCNVHVTGGKWYFEVRLLTNGSMRIGWATESWTASEALGGDGEGWGFDGSQGRKYSSGNSESFASSGWHQGDIVGCLLDLDAGTISYTYNCEDLGVAFSGVAAKAGLCPAVTLQRKQHLLFNFGDEDFCSPQTGASSLFMRITPDDLRELERLFDQYSTKHDAAPAPTPAIAAAVGAAGAAGVAAAAAAERTIEGEGILQLAAAMGQQGDMDPLLLVVMWKLGCKRQWAITHDEFVQGFANLGVGSMPNIKRKVGEWKRLLDDPAVFPEFYNFAFEYLRGEAKMLGIQDALMAWQMLGMERRWPLWKQWEEHVKKSKGISRDNWQQLVPFMTQFKNSMADYDPISSWPTLYDEFAEFVNKSTKK